MKQLKFTKEEIATMFKVAQADYTYIKEFGCYRPNSLHPSEGYTPDLRYPDTEELVSLLCGQAWVNGSRAPLGLKVKHLFWLMMSTLGGLFFATPDNASGGMFLLQTFLFLCLLIVACVLFVLMVRWVGDNYDKSII